MVLHPLGKEWLLPGALRVAKITWDKCLSDGKTGIRSEHHVGKLRLGRDQMNFAVQFRQRRVQVLPLRLDLRVVGASFGAHPWIDLVFNAVMIRRTKEQ